MKDIITDIQQTVAFAIKNTFGEDIGMDDLLITSTKKEHQGDYTIVTFPLAKKLRQSPVQIATFLKEFKLANMPEVQEAEVIQGFLNLSLSPGYWFSVLDKI